MTTPAQAKDDKDGKRIYTRDGVEYLSVTSVIAHLSKPALIPWAVKLTAEAALEDVQRHGVPTGAAASPVGKGRVAEWKRNWRKVRDASADRGSTFHDWAEHYVLGLQPPPPPGLEQECIGFIRCLKENRIEPLSAEATVFNRMHQYAGTCDLFADVGVWGGATAALDIKTGRSTWAETALQLAAYRAGEFIGIPNGPEVDVPNTLAGGVLHVDHGITHLIPYRCGKEEFEVFCHLREVAQWVGNESKTVKDVTYP